MQGRAILRISMLSHLRLCVPGGFREAKAVDEGTLTTLHTVATREGLGIRRKPKIGRYGVVGLFLRSAIEAGLV